MRKNARKGSGKKAASRSRSRSRSRSTHDDPLMIGTTIGDRFRAVESRLLGSMQNVNCRSIIDAVSRSADVAARRAVDDDLALEQPAEIPERGGHAFNLLAFLVLCHYGSSEKMIARANHALAAGVRLAQQIESAAVEIHTIADGHENGSREWVRLMKISNDLRQAAYDADDAARMVTAARREHEEARRTGS